MKELASILNINVGNVETIENHICTRPIGKLGLTHTYWWKQNGQSSLGRFEDESEQFLKFIVTTDEIWVHYFISTSQLSTKEWHHNGYPIPKKLRRTISAGKVMATLFWDSKRVIQLDFIQERRTINTKYSKILLGEVKGKIRSKRKTEGKLISFLQDNARPHTARKIMENIRKLKWDLLPHVSYSPDVASNDFFIWET